VSEEQIRLLLQCHLPPLTNVDSPRSHGRIVKSNDAAQIVVRYGRTNTFKVTYAELIAILTSAVENTHIYNRDVLREFRQTDDLIPGCSVHIIGMIFVRAKLAAPNGANNYRILA
jgi:hypothetical protein